MAVNPEYLKTDQDNQVNNFRDWGIPLGRRFRALKLWFVLRNYGAEKLREMIRNHISLAKNFGTWVEESQQWELLAPVPLNTVCFRWNPGQCSEEKLDSLNKELLEAVNAEGTIYLTHTKLRGKFSLRVAVGQTATREKHVVQAWEKLNEVMKSLPSS